MKVIVVDDEVIIGSANVTGKGMSGKGEIAVVFKEMPYADYMEKTYEDFISRKHKICRSCPYIGLNECGSLYDLFPKMLKTLEVKAKAKNNRKLLEWIANAKFLASLPQ